MDNTFWSKQRNTNYYLKIFRKNQLFVFVVQQIILKNTKTQNNKILLILCIYLNKKYLKIKKFYLTNFVFLIFAGEEIKGHENSRAATGEGAEGMYGRIVTQDQLMALAAVQQSQSQPLQVLQLDLEPRNAGEVMVTGNLNDFLLYSSHPPLHQQSVICSTSVQQALSQNVISSTNPLSMVFQQPASSGSLNSYIPSTASPNSTTNCIMTAAPSSGPLHSASSRYRDHKQAPIQKLSVDLIKTYKHINEVIYLL